MSDAKNSVDRTISPEGRVANSVCWLSLVEANSVLAAGIANAALASAGAMSGGGGRSREMSWTSIAWGRRTGAGREGVSTMNANTEMT